MRRLPYAAVCVLLGLVLAWAPMLVHGPIPEKFDVLYIQGSIAIWAYYLSRLLIGYWVGVTAWPRPWWIRGPLCGFLSLLPITFLALGMPGCGLPCMLWNLSTATAVGATVAGLAYAITGRHHA
jgi:hypothetical protein